VSRDYVNVWISTPIHGCERDDTTYGLAKAAPAKRTTERSDEVSIVKKRGKRRVVDRIGTEKREKKTRFLVHHPT
jgi:hypothetical protein